MHSESGSNFQRTYQKYYKIFKSHWLPYVEANNTYTKAEMLVSYLTKECAKQTEKAADYTILTVFHVKEALIDKARRM